ncbi:MAG: hypothetical protein ACRESS_03135 [Stenotrophobium sp.]
MSAKAATELRRELKSDKGLDLLDSLDQAEATVLLNGMHTAQAREKAALDQAIDNSLRMVPFVLRGAFKKVLFP